MWSHFPPEPTPIDDGPERRSAPPKPPGPSRLLPVVQCLAEGGLLAVFAAAVQALFGEVPTIGPFEFAILAGAGMAWARRHRWRGPLGEAFGLPFLAIGAGALTWILAPEVRIALLSGDLQAAIAAHPGGWIGALAILRGHAHHSREVDEEVQDRLMRWGLPTVAIAWLVGDIAARQAGTGIEDAFTAVAFLGALVFVGAGTLALGLARLASVRSDGAGSASWFGFILVVAVGITAIGIPAALLLGVPLSTALMALIAPIRVIGALIVLILSPVMLLAALLVDAAQGVLPEGFGAGTLRLPTIHLGVRDPSSPVPGIVFWVAFAVIVLLELAAVAIYIWWRWRERRLMDAAIGELGEEREVVFDRPARPPRPPRPEATPRGDRHDPSGAYLLALDALAADGRWPHERAETPRDHLARIGDAYPVAGPLRRLAAAYELIRYAGRPLGSRERARSPGRLGRVEEAISRH